MQKEAIERSRAMSSQNKVKFSVPPARGIIVSNLGISLLQAKIHHSTLVLVLILTH